MGGDKMSHSPYLDSCNMIEKSCNYSAPPMGMSNRLTVVLQQELH